MDLISTLRYAAKRKKEEEAKKGEGSGESETDDGASGVDQAPVEGDGRSGPDESTPGSDS